MVKRRACAGVLAGLCGLALAACGSNGLVGNLNAGTLSGMFHVLPGEKIDSVAELANRSGHTVTLRSAHILTLKGFHSPRLVGVAVERRGRTLRGVMTGGALAGWPNRSLHVLELSGYRLPPRGSWYRNTAFIVFAVTAHRPGRYALAGINVVVEENGSTTTAEAIGPVAVCVSTLEHPVNCPKSFTDRAMKASIALK